jgi:hypothetical protein
MRRQRIAAVARDSIVLRSHIREAQMAILLKDNNVVSLRTAHVCDDGNLVSFCLMPADLVSLMPPPKKVVGPKGF